jgi:hypothetical protein
MLRLRLDILSKICCYWFLLGVVWYRFGFHRCVAAYVECESLSSNEKGQAHPEEKP